MRRWRSCWRSSWRRRGWTEPALLRRGVHLVGVVLELVLDLLAFRAERIGLRLAGLLVGAALGHRFLEVGVGLVGLVDRGGLLLDFVLGLAVAAGERETGGGDRGEDRALVHS